MKLFVASDHAGFDLKNSLVQSLKQNSSFEIVDLGTDSTQSCDYPVFAFRVCDELTKVPGALGLLICGSGIGMSIAANKVRGIRAAVVSDEKAARLAREHNDAQVLCLGARIVSEEVARRCLMAFLGAAFDRSSDRHQRRIDLISQREGAPSCR